MDVPRDHARRGDAFGFFVGQLCRKEAPAHAFELVQLLVFVRRNEIAGERAVARHGNRLALRQQLVAAEVAGELGGWNGVSHVHASSLSHMTIYALCAKNAISALCVNTWLELYVVYDINLYHSVLKARPAHGPEGAQRSAHRSN